MSALTEALNWRYATKKFDPSKKVSDADLQDLLEAIRLSPSSYGIQPWKFLVIANPDTRKKLREHSWDQSQVTDASHLIVLCARTGLSEKDIDAYVEEIISARGVTKEQLESYRQMMLNPVKRMSTGELTEWNQKQVYIALGILMAAAAIKGIDTCPMEGFDASKYDEILGLTARGLTATVVCPVGYRASDDGHAALAKVRFAKDKIVEVI